MMFSLGSDLKPRWSESILYLSWEQQIIAIEPVPIQRTHLVKAVDESWFNNTIEVRFGKQACDKHLQRSSHQGIQSSLHATCPDAHRSPHITRLWYTFLRSLNSFTKSSISFPLPFPLPFTGEVGRSVDEDCTNTEASASDWSSWAVVACRRRIKRNWGVNRYSPRVTRVFRSKIDDENGIKEIKRTWYTSRCSLSKSFHFHSSALASSNASCVWLLSWYKFSCNAILLSINFSSNPHRVCGASKDRCKTHSLLTH